MPSATIDVINLALMEHPVIDSLLVNQRLVCPSLQAETTLAGHISGRSTVYWRHIQLSAPAPSRRCRPESGWKLKVA